MDSVSTDQPGLDLTVCDQEPIRIPGSVQPHGFLLALDAERRIVQASDNLAAITGLAPETVLGQPLQAALGDAAAQVLKELAQHPVGSRPSYFGTIAVGGRGQFDVLAHVHDGLTLVEFEAAPRTAPADFRMLYPLIGEFLSQLGESSAIEAMSDIAARQIKQVTQFGRVLVYRFDEDGHGHVVAEACDDGYPSYLGHRFPASDIPRQARELYVSSRIRLIPDANYTPARLVPPLNPATGAPTDLSYSALRSVSPIHLQYMRNMHTLASMSVSIVIKGRLWGLISCHHETPRYVPFEARAACEQLAQVLALRIESKEEGDEFQWRLELRRILVSLLAELTKGPDIADHMRTVTPELLRFASAGGAVLYLDGRMTLFGDTPEEADLHALIDWLGANFHGECFHTDALATLIPDAARYARNASGMLALPLSRTHNHYLMWFRPEVIHTINWAGDPHQKTAAPAGPLTPRASFATWRETVHGRSEPWRASEIEIALEFRAALLGIVLERAEAMAELAEELGRANKELEAFSYSVSHDLRAPLRHIVGFSDLLMEMEDVETNSRRSRFLKNIKDSARFAGKLVDDLLSFSQMGRASLRPCRVNMDELVRACLERLEMETATRAIEWKIGPLPAIEADPTFLQLAIYNLLANAVKYTAPRAQAVIEVFSESNDDETVFCVRDNGVGFNPDYVHKLFGVFQRLHRMEDFQGTGIGLANVRRIVERHGGRVWAEGAVDRGASFYFAIPKHISVT
ncbi:GAF domain-containing protein [Oxalobacteraceae bacterium OM1]|nr:GAF domain-containing protein [Oxalobacteraceae bacterium OM1]